MARILTQEISGTECIGDTRPKINTNFENLDTALVTLSTYTISFDQILSAYNSDIINPVLTVVRSNSATWEESSEILPTVTNYLSTSLVMMSAVSATGNFVIEVNNTNAALRVTQTGTGNAILVEDNVNPDSTPFVVNQTGAVGIGTTTPAYKFDLQQSGNLYQGIRIRNPDATSGAGSILQLGNNTSGVAASLFLNSSTNSNFGSGSLVLSHGLANPIVFATNGFERMRIEADGKVGISTTTPNENLTVVGGISASDFIRGIMPLSGHSDIQFLNLSANQVLRFDGTRWRNHDNTAAQQLSGLTDIQIIYPLLSGQVLKHNGTKWYNDFDLADVTDGLRNDIRVTNTGTAWTIVSGAVTYDKLSNTVLPISANVKSRVAKAWLNYDGINNIIRSSYNISSVTNLGTGHYKIVYTPGTFIDANYSFIATCDETFSAGSIGYYIWSQPTNFTLSSTDVKHRSYAAGTTETNPSILSVVVFASGN